MKQSQRGKERWAQFKQIMKPYAKFAKLALKTLQQMGKNAQRNISTENVDLFPYYGEPKARRHKRRKPKL